MVPGALIVFSEPLSLSATPSTPPRATAGAAKLTTAERAIVFAVLLGETLGKIADARGVSEGTVRKQLGSAYAKLGVHSRSELAALEADIRDAHEARE